MKRDFENALVVSEILRNNCKHINLHKIYK